MDNTNRYQKEQRQPAPIKCKEMESITADIHLLTPIFGGGAISQTLDLNNPIRSASIKGQLRFWWRAARAGGKSLDELKEEETRLWGGPNVEGIISISVNDQKITTTPVHFFEMQNNRLRTKRDNEALAYLGFPLQPSQEEIRQGIGPRPAMQANGHFTLTLHVNKQHLEYRPCNDHSKGDIFEAKAALWAWLHFGGIGGRTRRGFGAVSIDDPKDINDLLSSPYIINEQPPEGVPTLAPSFGASIVIQNTNNTAENAWQALASKYKNFRQGDKCGRNPPQLGSHAGRSRWPEPDIIRHDLTGRYQGSPRHSRRNTSVVKAPRGQFGMPIIFQFPQENELGSVTLKPKNAERLASPLILRPIGTVTQAKAMILLLGNRPNLDCIGGGTCMADKVSRISISTYLTQAEANNIKPLQGNTDPLIAFMDFFQK